FGGASKSLMQFLILANRTGRRPVLPGVAERGITDRTIYRSADRSNVEDLDQFLDLGSLTLDPGLPARGFREHIKEKGKILDAVVFIVLNPFQRPRFSHLNRKSVVQECMGMWIRCRRKPLHCGEYFMWISDMRGLDSWELAPGGKVWCVHNNFLRWNQTLGDWFDAFFQDAPNVAIINWVGAVSPPCRSSNRVCSAQEDSQGEAGSIEFYMQRLRLSNSISQLADRFLASHPELNASSAGTGYNSVHLRAEMVLNYRYLSPKCNDSGVYTWFADLKRNISTWNGTWFRARDLKPGGSRTLARYDPEIYQRLVKLELDLWRDAPATFVENDCRSLRGVKCFLLDVALLSRGQQLVLWGSSGGVDLLCRIERKRLGMPRKTTFRSMLTPEGC
ncbi:unnamed protein product, partial [Durusdinium trenchii]